MSYTGEKKDEYNRKRREKYKADPTSVKATNAVWYKENSKTVKEKVKKWKENNPEKLREYRGKNKDKKSEYDRILYLKGPERKKERSRINGRIDRATNPEKYKAKHRKYNLWLLYRLTPEEAKAIEEFEKINTPLLLGQRNGMDHRHDTGQIYGLLDWRLNRALGLIEKVNKERTSDVLRALAEYLDNPPAVQALGRKVYGMIGIAKPNKKIKVYGSENGPLPVVKSKKNKEKKA